MTSKHQVAWWFYDQSAWLMGKTTLRRRPWFKLIWYSRPLTWLREGVLSHGPGTTTVHGSQMFVPNQAPFYPAGMLRGEYEKETVQCVQDVLSPGMSMIDVGAHVGYYTLAAARTVGPTGAVYAFEPHPASYPMLLRNVEINEYQQVTVVSKAVADSNGTAELALGDNPALSSLFHGQYATGETHRIETAQLDTFFESLGWPKIDLVKMNIEGAEIAALTGMRSLIERNPEMMIIVEFAMDCMEGSEISPDQLFERISSLGFKHFYDLRADRREVRIPDEIEQMKRMYRVHKTNILCTKLARPQSA